MRTLVDIILLLVGISCIAGGIAMSYEQFKKRERLGTFFEGIIMAGVGIWLVYIFIGSR